MVVTYEHLIKESESDKWYLDEDDGVEEGGKNIILEENESFIKVKVTDNDSYLTNKSGKWNLDEDDGEGEEIEEYETRSLQAPRLPVLSGLQESESYLR